MKIKFVTSVAHLSSLPVSHRPEVALAGRSNAGKSTLINLLSDTPVAKVSQKPGKTTLLNFFTVGEHYSLVDMPGYGFASRSQAEMDTWEPLIEGFFRTRSTLCLVLLLMDIRRNWSESETQLLKFLNKIHRPVLVLLTKADKLSRQDVKKRVEAMSQKTKGAPVRAISYEDRPSVKLVEEYMFKKWIQPLLCAPTHERKP